uniref:LRAT domain-containing protein n=1 Tax=Arion vulgaris TaxID=1028688 RepID=A0A0B7AI19_9EUPU
MFKVIYNEVKIKVMDEITIRRHNLDILAHARPGDLLEFPRVFYSHWGVYIGNNKVIHLAGEPGDGVSITDATVREEDFWAVARTSLVKINNILDGTERALPPDQVVKRAKEKRGHGGYNLLFTNCEHFVTWCRYDKAKSTQVEAIGTAFSVIGNRVKEILVDAAENHPDEERSTASGLLWLTENVTRQAEQMVKNRKNEQLKGLNPK